jgi:hypothetical protein
MRNPCSLLICCLALALGASVAAAQGQAARDSVLIKALTEQRGTENAPLVITLDSAQRANDTRERDLERQHATEREDAILIALWVLAGIALLQAAFFLWQLMTMKRSLADTALAAQAAERAATAAEESVAGAGTAQRQSRAYLDVQFEGITGQSGGTVGGFRILVRNDGQTPALKTSVTMQLQVLPTAALDTFTFPERPIGDQMGMIVIPARGSRKIGSRMIESLLTPRQVAEVMAGADDRGELRLCCWGVVRYADVFDNPRWTRFCFLYGGAVSQRKRKRAARCHRHNDTSDAPDSTLPEPKRVTGNG